MTEKKELMEIFRKKPERYWKVRLFEERGFKRYRCKRCGSFFWSLTEQEVCNSCKPYEFIGNPPTRKKVDYFEMWKIVRDFFVKNGHFPLERYPTVCRWYPLYFTIAGIVDFYRVSEDGSLDWEIRENPSILLQPCLRFNDIENVGLNGRSFTSFGMIQQTSLYKEGTGYWKDRCIELDFELLTKVLGIKEELINFIEDVWIGHGAFGSSLEYHVGGLELGNAVFTEFRGTPTNFTTMKEKIIDMGAGWERFAWISNGTRTSYDVVFGKLVERMMKECKVEVDENYEKFCKLAGSIDVEETDVEKEVERIAKLVGTKVESLKEQVESMRGIYSVLDHTRTLLFAISDGGIPSNVAGGYNLRVILRRALSFIEKLKCGIEIEEIIELHSKRLKKLFPELGKEPNLIFDILDTEKKRYEKTKERMRRIIANIQKPSEEDLIRLYESEGITPEQLGVKVPREFYIRITEKHMKEKS
ncbi:MAG: alanine--tRNA ligase-related protein, partial [Candidatus Syntropharchaeia archaeon]